MTWSDHIGLDIGGNTIKLVQLSPSGSGFKLVALGHTERPEDVSLSTVASDITPLVEVVKDLVRSTHASTNKVVIALPESGIYTRLLKMPEMNEVDLTQAIKFQIEQYVPLPASEIIEKHTVVARAPASPQNPGGQMDVLLVASPTFLIDRYRQLIDLCGLEILAIDTEVLAAGRALIDSKSSPLATILVNIGAAGIDLSIIKDSNLIATRSLSTGGLALTRAIMTELNLDLKQAEGYKRTVGLDDSKLSGNLTKAIAPVLEQLVSEIKRILETAEPASSETKIRRIVLSGGGALLPNIVPFLASSLNFEVQIGSPFAQVNKTDEQAKYIGETGAIYAVSVGLALKEI